MLIPAKQVLVALHGGTFDIDLKFWQDTANTIPFPLTGYDVEVEFDEIAVLTPGHGLTIDATNGLVSLVLTAVQTRQSSLGVYPYRVKLTDRVSGEVLFPLAGSLTVDVP